MIDEIRHIARRRRVLRDKTGYVRNFAAWEESCVPSYCHPNPFAAFVSWQRLYGAIGLARRFSPDGKSVLDFGASVGELGILLSTEQRQYSFIEAHEPAVALLISQLPRAQRIFVEMLPGPGYDWIFAIDSLEHNADYADLLHRLTDALSPNGVLIVSGPTENWIYRLGRRIAGFHGNYHLTNVHEIEAAAGKWLKRQGRITLPFGLPLFRLTAWSHGGEKPERAFQR